MRRILRSPSRPAVLALVTIVALDAAIAARQARAEWPTFGRAITLAPASQTHPQIAADGAGGAIITWQDQRSRLVNVFVQHVLASGDVDGAWPLNGRALLQDSLALRGADGGQFAPQIVSDGAGGAIAVWQDARSPATELDLFAQHVLANGVVDPGWPANGAPVVVVAKVQNAQVLIPDGLGGAIVAWMDTRPGASVSDLYAQHLLSSGHLDGRWPPNGLVVSAAAGAQQGPAMVGDGAGGAIVTWFDDRGTASGSDIYAQHVLGSGVVDPAWPADGRAVCSAPGDQGGPTLASDGAHGAIIAWSDSRAVATSHIFAAHVLASGVLDPAWPVNGRAISAAGVAEGRPLAVSDDAGGAIVNWQALNVHVNMFAQHVLGAGVVDPRWPAGGRALSLTNRTQDHGAIVPDGTGGAVVAWEDSSNVYAQHVLAAGTLDAAYPDTGRVVVDLPGQQGVPQLVATPQSGAIVTWADTRNAGTSPDIFALQVLEAGTSAVPPSSPPAGIRLDPPRPNPSLGLVTLRFSLPRSLPLRLTIHDVSGRRVRTLVSGTRPAGDQVVTWDLRDDRGGVIGSGLYFARLESGGRIWSTRLTALR